MPLRQLLVTRDRQPQEAVGIDWTNPLTKGLIFLAVPGGPDLVSGTHPLPIGSSDVKTGPDGLVLDSPSTTTGGWYWPLPASHPLYSVTTEVSLFLRARITTTSAYNAQLCVPYRSGSWTPPYTSLDMCANDGGRKGRLAFATGGSIHEAAASKSTFLDPGGVKSYAVTKAGTAVLWYLDGQQDDSGTASSGGSIDWNTKQPLCLFNHSNSSTGEGMIASASIVVAHNRPLSAAEEAALHANPWQLFEPIRVWMPVAAAGGAVSLTIADCSHGHAAEAVVLTSQTALSVADASHAHAAEAVTLSTQTALSVADVSHAHAADNLTLGTTGSANLTVQDATHAHAADGPALTSQTGLTIADASHSHQAEGLTLSASAYLAVADASHAQLADSLDLSGAPSLLIQNAAHGHLAESPALTTAAWLAIAGALHAHAADSLTLTTGDDQDELYPLEGLSQSYPMTGEQAYPLAGQSQTYPLGN